MSIVASAIADPAGREDEMLTPEELQHAPLIAKLREWNLTYTIEKEFPIASLRKAADVQVRESAHLAPAHRVEEYSQQLRNGAMFPPILVRQPDILIDGNTRLAAAKRIGRQTFPAIVVDTRTSEMAKILAAAVNQMGGERLTSGEAHTSALLMMQQGYPDHAVARELGRDLSVVRKWRDQRDVEQRAEEMGLAEQVKLIPRSTLGALAKVDHDEPFRELTRLFADVRPVEKQARDLVAQVVQSTSDEAAVAKVATLREELAPAGPPPHVATRSEVPLVRAAIANILKLAGRPTAGFDPVKRDEEVERWENLRRVVEEVLGALRV